MEFNLDFCDKLNLIIENNMAELSKQFYNIFNQYKDVIAEKVMEVKEIAEKLKQMNSPLCR